MNKKEKEAVSSFGAIGVIVSILSWIFVPEDFSFIVGDSPMKVKMFLVIMIFVIAVICIMIKLLIDKNNELKEMDAEFQAEKSSMKSSYAEKEMNLKLQNESLKKSIEKEELEMEKMKKKEIEDGKNIQEKEEQIKNQQATYKELNENYKKLNEKYNVLNEKYNVLKTEKDDVVNTNTNVVKELKDELKTKDDKINILQTTIDDIWSFNKINTWRHTVLIIDDKAAVIKDLKKRLADMPCDIVYLNRLEDYRIVENFEIIISDVLRCSPGEDAVLTLNTIKKYYPYKFVIAMSSAPTECHGLEIDGAIIEKGEASKQYTKVIKERINECIEKLDNPSEHWEHVSYSLSLKYKKRTNKIEFIKNNYISTLKRLSN